MKNTIQSILDNKIIMILRGVPSEQLVPLAEAMYRGGIRLLEITYDPAGKTPDEQIARDVALLCKAMQGRMLIGAGTVLTERQVALTAEAGGKFIISPDTNAAVIAETKRQGLVSIPGALTPSEVTAAHRAGADFIKLFPIASMGASYLKAIHAPLSHVRFLAVGGVRPENMAEYRSAGALGFGCGLVDSDRAALRAGDLTPIEQRCAALVDALG